MNGQSNQASEKNLAVPVFLDEVEHMEHYIRIGLLEFEDLNLLGYYMKKIRGHHFTEYLNTYDYSLVQPFLDRFN
jgi:hypothetical protein